MTEPFSAEEKKLLIEIAREAIVANLTGEKPQQRETMPSNFLVKRGCFVSIKQNSTLRGCIGNFVSDKPLHELVREMAVAAATLDPRFYPMKRADLDDFELEISVLSPLRKIDSVEDIQVGLHGLYLEKNVSRGVLLPQVAVECGWDRETFLRQTCLKAGLHEDDWQEGANIYIFTAEVFGQVNGQEIKP
ncbi:MAG: AmmeMemoRadiSam system protein A [Geobacteraceae bacterium]